MPIPDVKSKTITCFVRDQFLVDHLKGLIKDVSIKGKHPVYRYANPIFMEVSNDK